MPLNAQTSGFPPISQSERSWALELSSLADLLFPVSGIRSGLALGFPLSSGQPTTGLMPTATDGKIVLGDSVYGPFGSKLISVATANWANKKYWFSPTKGIFYYADTAEKSNDVQLAEVSTDNGSPAAIMAIGQPTIQGGNRFGMRGVVNLAKCTKGADTNLFTWAAPAALSGFSNARIVHAQVKTATIVTAGNTAGDDFVLKVGATTLVTHAVASLTSANAVTVGTVANYPVVDPVAGLVFRYNQTDTSTAITGGSLEVNVLFELF